LLKWVKIHWCGSFGGAAAYKYAVDVVRHSVPDNVHQLHVLTTCHVWKTKGCPCSFRLLMMGGVSPETRRASYKYGIIKFWYIVASCWIFLYELYCDARNHKHQVLYELYCDARNHKHHVLYELYCDARNHKHQVHKKGIIFLKNWRAWEKNTLAQFQRSK
jgi:hypothetical protein